MRFTGIEETLDSKIRETQKLPPLRPVRCRYCVGSPDEWRHTTELHDHAYSMETGTPCACPACMAARITEPLRDFETKRQAALRMLERKMAECSPRMPWEERLGAWCARNAALLWFAWVLSLLVAIGVTVWSAR